MNLSEPRCNPVKDILLLCSFCNFPSFTHVYREANFTADVTANLGHGLHPSTLWEHELSLSYCRRD
ncbi:hypothetical protein GBA52_010029 [Prunus armeniaca]|nr:hypothetical protein GBA52_010029 [Prunus armeniaca]